MKSSIFLNRKQKIIIPDGSSSLDSKYIHTLQNIIKDYGYIFSDEVLIKMKFLSKDQIKSVHDEVLFFLRESMGLLKELTPLFPNFPQQVETTSLEELSEINHFHYIGDHLGIRLIPKFVIHKQKKLMEHTQFTEINLGTESEFNQIFSNILNSKSSISSEDNSDLAWFFNENKLTIENYLPTKIYHKEILAEVSNLIFRHRPELTNYISKQIQSATDVLRIYTSISGGDVSLATNTKFININRKYRRWILSLIESVNDKNVIAEDFKLHKNKWKRVGERLHPSEYKKKYPNVAYAFSVIRNNTKVNGYNHQLEEAFANLELKRSIKLLKQKPGVFARRLDHMLRIFRTSSYILDQFAKLASDISTNVLLQMYAHFKSRSTKQNLQIFSPIKSRSTKQNLRIFFPKGQVANAYAINNELPPMSSYVQKRVLKIIESALIKKFSLRPPLGKVFLDKNLKQFTIPFLQRSASKTLKTIPRGSRINLPAGKTLRFFLWWKDSVINGDANDRVDIDLSAVVFDEYWQYKSHVSYTNLKSDSDSIFHSGDITSAPNGASEFIDINMDKTKKNGGRYIVISLNSFTEQPYCDLPECFAGWMLREKPNSGEIYEPRTVKQKIDISANTRVSMPVIIDLENNEIIWIDLALKRNLSWYNNVEANMKGMNLIGHAMTERQLPNLYDLFNFHIKARGSTTDDIELADTVFSIETGVTPYDTEEINSKFL